MLEADDFAITLPFALAWVDPYTHAVYITTSADGISWRQDPVYLPVFDDVTNHAAAIGRVGLAWNYSERRFILSYLNRNGPMLIRTSADAQDWMGAYYEGEYQNILVIGEEGATPGLASFHGTSAACSWVFDYCSVAWNSAESFSVVHLADFDLHRVQNSDNIVVRLRQVDGFENFESVSVPTVAYSFLWDALVSFRPPSGAAAHLSRGLNFRTSGGTQWPDTQTRSAPGLAYSPYWNEFLAVIVVDE